MNKLFKLLFVLPAMTLAVSCSSDEPSDMPSGQSEATMGVSAFTKISELYQPVHGELLADLLAGKQAMTFSCQGWESYRRFDDEVKYEYFDMTGWYGFTNSMPDEIIFSDGHAWAPYSTFSSSFGPSKFGTAWAAYKKATGVITSLYVGHDFAYDASSRRLTFLGREFDMLLFNRNNIIVAENGPCWQSCPEENRMKEGDCFHITSYKRTADVAMLAPGALGFASNDEVAAYIIEKCREYFGEVINLNEVYAPGAMFDNPYIYIKDLETLLASGGRQGAY